MFREGVKPEWEDPINSDGGELLFRGADLELVNQMWYELVLAMVGEVLEQGEKLVGARVLDKSAKGKQEYRIEVWFSNGVDVTRLTPQLTAKLNDNMSTQQNFSFTTRMHSAALQKNQSKPPGAPKGEVREKGNITKPNFRDKPIGAR